MNDGNLHVAKDEEQARCFSEFHTFAFMGLSCVQFYKPGRTEIERLNWIQHTARAWIGVFIGVRSTIPNFWENPHKKTGFFFFVSLCAKKGNDSTRASERCEEGKNPEKTVILR
jgi:hypothetical protein